LPKQGSVNGPPPIFPMSSTTSSKGTNATVDTATFHKGEQQAVRRHLHYTKPGSSSSSSSSNEIRGVLLPSSVTTTISIEYAYAVHPGVEASCKALQPLEADLLQKMQRSVMSSIRGHMLE